MNFWLFLQFLLYFSIMSKTQQDLSQTTDQEQISKDIEQEESD